MGILTDYVQKNFMDSNITVYNLAHMVHITPSYCTRIFRPAYGCEPAGICAAATGAVGPESAGAGVYHGPGGKTGRIYLYSDHAENFETIPGKITCNCRLALGRQLPFLRGR